MAHLFQAGAGSGGAVVLDLLIREPAITRVTLIEPDTYNSHNVHRHLFPPSTVGRLKAELMAEWVRERRPNIHFDQIVADLTDSSRQFEFANLAAACDIGVCAVDNEPAKYAFNSLMMNAGKPWTLGEVLSGGIGGWIHRFTPGGACYGCVASHLQRTVNEAPPAVAPNYASPEGVIPETTIPASKASIGVIASLHALATLEGLTPIPPLSTGTNGGFTSLLVSLARAPGVFDEAFRTIRFRVPRSADCLFCSKTAASVAEGDLDVAVDQALARLAPQ